MWIHEIFENVVIYGHGRNSLLFKYVQSLEYETGQTVVFWDILWPKYSVCKNCVTHFALECSPKPPWPTGFEKSEIHQPNP